MRGKKRANSFIPEDEAYYNDSMSESLDPIDTSKINIDNIGAEVQNPTGINNTRRRVGYELQEIAPMRSSASVGNPTGIAKPGKEVEKAEVEKTTTISDLLAPFRKAAKEDKTDAVKMQKYYALTDALRSLGNMGGAAVGGAIGGNMMDSAPAVAEYKPNRGYLDAIEKAKNANDRLRALDEKEFQLRYQKSQKDAERERQELAQQAERDWQMKFFDYKTKIEQAIADKRFEDSARLQKEMAADAQRYKMEVQNLINAGNLAEKKVGAQISDDQYKSPVWFDDGSFMEIPDKDYKSIQESLKGKTINGVYITKDNVEQFMRANPDVVKRYARPKKDDDSNSNKTSDSKENKTTESTSTPSQNEANFKNYYEDYKKSMSGNSVEEDRWASTVVNI
jgi:hypothetical protein